MCIQCSWDTGRAWERSYVNGLSSFSTSCVCLLFVNVTNGLVCLSFWASSWALKLFLKYVLHWHTDRLNCLLAPYTLHSLSLNTRSNDFIRTRILNVWRHVRGKIASWIAVRGESGVAGEGRVVGLQNFHSWGKCTMPLTNINSDWISNTSFGLCINLVIYIEHNRTPRCSYEVSAAGLSWLEHFRVQ